jgi:hypothetical protein
MLPPHQLRPNPMILAQPQPQDIWLPHTYAIVTWSQIPPERKPCRLPFNSQRQVFHLFPRLPIELRLRIWTFASPGRVIELRSWGDTANNPYVPIKYSVAKHTFPIILHINRESRREGLRFYQCVEVGISTTILDPSRRYLPWRYHPQNPNSMLPFSGARYYAPLAFPYPAQKIYVDFSQDIIYLGPEFNQQHLQNFLTATGPGLELADLQYLALDRKHWVNGAIEHRGTGFAYLRAALFSLSRRPLKELYIVPDDEPNHLADQYYYRQHEITLETPPYEYRFRPEGQTEHAKKVVENLEEWTKRLWVGREAPKVRIRSLRRQGKRMTCYKGGIWEVQRLLGDMGAWKTWVPTLP